MATIPPHPRRWLVMSLVAALVFLLLAIYYRTGSPVNRVDVWLGFVLHGLEERDITWLNTSMVGISFFGATGSLLVAACVGLSLLHQRSWSQFLLWMAAIAGGILLNRVLKASFETLRPMVGHTDRFEESTGFPSGHAMVAVVTYSLLAYLAAARMVRPSRRVAGFVVAGALVVLISFSRLFLALHYLSDVLGGLAAGVAWLSMCLWLYQRSTLPCPQQTPSFSVDSSQGSAHTD